MKAYYARSSDGRIWRVKDYGKTICDYCGIDKREGMTREEFKREFSTGKVGDDR